MSVRTPGASFVIATKNEGSTFPNGFNTYYVTERESVDQRIDSLRAEGYRIFFVTRLVNVVDDNI